MKKIILYFTLFISVKGYSQAIEYVYDGNGNRTERRLYVTPCPTCPQNGRVASTPPAPEAAVQEQVAAQHGLNVFPNPTQDKVNLTLSNLKDDETTSVTVIDEGGKTVYSAKNLQSQNEINMAGFNNGTYFVRVIVGKDVVIYKVMKVQ
jgi:hypothetical protein